MTYTFLSKRKVDKLAKLGVICGWDDPRLYTVLGMRRRGVTKEAINYFCDCLSVTRTNNDAFIQIEYFENVVRRDLNDNCRRTLAVLDKVKFVLDDMDENEVLSYNCPVYPNNKESKETYEVKLGKFVWVDRSDVREIDSKDFYGITPGKTIRLKYGPAIKVSWDKFILSDDGKILEIHANRLSLEDDLKCKPKGVLSWVSDIDSCFVEVRNYEHLFINPHPHKDNWLEEINPNSKKVMTNAVINKGLVDGLKVLDKFQFERIGFYTVDSDSDFEAGKIVFNLTVGLPTSSKKKTLN